MGRAFTYIDLLRSAARCSWRCAQDKSTSHPPPAGLPIKAASILEATTSQLWRMSLCQPICICTDTKVAGH